MRKYLVLTTFCFSFNLLNAQQITGARITALANAGVAMQDVFSLQKNQAGIAFLIDPEIALAYESKFLLNDLSNKSAAFVLPSKNYALGLSIENNGFTTYNETKAGLSLAKKFGTQLAVALNFNFHQISISNYGSSQTFSFEAGMQYHLSPKIWLGSHIANPNQSKFNNNAEMIIPSHIQFGGSFLFSDQLMAVTEIEKIADQQLDLKSGIEYQIKELISLRAGLSVNPFKQYGGFGLLYKKIDLDFCISSHPILGYSPQITLGYGF